ncbi:hypothetical protein JHK82_012969 [Glycine max]|nr:hypothetical protein JHK82_012969 [Glycine max]
MVATETEIANADRKAINDWLPVTASRNAKWWYSAFHNITAMVGAGVLTLPYAMSMMGWYHELGQHAFGEKLGLYIVVPQQLLVQLFHFMLAMGEVAFSYAGHNVVLEIQATIPSTPEKPSKKAMWKGVIVAYLGVAFCYLPVAFIGYYIFGNSVDDNILITLDTPAWLIAAANMFVVVHVIGG